jgi:hypothetical protein
VVVAQRATVDFASGIRAGCAGKRAGTPAPLEKYFLIFSVGRASPPASPQGGDKGAGTTMPAYLSAYMPFTRLPCGRRETRLQTGRIAA